MKIISPYSAEQIRGLQQENDRLRQENAALQAEVQRYREKYGTLNEAKTASVKHGLPSGKISRSNPTITPRVVQRDADGRLLTMAAVVTASYAKSTQASQSKLKNPPTQQDLHAGPSWITGEDDEDVRWPADQQSETSGESETGPTTDSGYGSEFDDVPCACPPCTAILNADDSLEKRSRLRDNDFYTAYPASKVRIPIKTQLYYLRKAYSLAQATLWHVLRDHWPQAQRSYYLEGPDQVRFGHSELERCFGNSRYPSQHNRMCKLPPDSVLAHIYQVIDLRNAVCHPSAHTTREIDSLMERAQGLAIGLLDEIRAVRVRRLRDDVQRAAMREFDEIVALEPLSWLPGARSWALHHQIYFRDVPGDLHHRQQLAGLDSVRHDAGVVRAARSWGLRCSSPGAEDPKYVAVMKSKAAYVREAGKGRRASFGVVLGARGQADEVVPAQQCMILWHTVPNMHLQTTSVLLLLASSAFAVPGSKGKDKSKDKSKDKETPAKPGNSKPGAPAQPGGSKGNTLPLRPAGQASSSKTPVAKQLKFSDVFDAVTGDKVDSCDDYLDYEALPGKSKKTLNRRWDEAYEIAREGMQVVGEQYEQNVERRKLVQSFFGIKPAKGGKIPIEGFEGEAFDKLQDFHERMFTYITTPQSGEDKVLIMCGSDGMKLQQPWDNFKNEAGEDTDDCLMVILQEQGFDYNNYWFWWNEHTKDYMPLARNPPGATGPFPGEIDGDWYCKAKAGTHYGGYTAANNRVRPEDSQFLTRLRTYKPFIMMCPENLEAPYSEDLEPFGQRRGDRRNFGTGVPLEALESRASLFYHELVHMIIQMTDPMKGDKIAAPDAQAKGAAMNAEGKAVSGFPAMKEAWEVRAAHAAGPIRSMYLALHDMASPQVQDVEELEALGYPESYAWFGITNALYTKRQWDWSSGVSKKAGGEWEGVWTSDDRYTDDRHGIVPFQTDEGREEEERAATASGDFEGAIGLDAPS